MPSSERPEKRGTIASYPRGSSFADLLFWHLKFGTRPHSGPDRSGQRWSIKGFARELRIEERAVRYWRTGKRPVDLASIQRVLFGDNAAYDERRFDLGAAYDGLRPSIIDGEVPFPPADFLGRKADVVKVLDALFSSAGTRAILIQGAPGIGKIALTKAVANKCRVGSTETPTAMAAWACSAESAPNASNQRKQPPCCAVLIPVNTLAWSAT
jgi:hypothetical protein